MKKFEDVETSMADSTRVFEEWQDEHGQAVAGKGWGRSPYLTK
jgi:hypothetical protein